MSPALLLLYTKVQVPRAIEEVCVPAIEDNSGLHYNQDFYCGYSPERINPGDKKNRLESIVKVTSGSNDTVASIVDSLYASIVTAGTFKAANIKVAEASKVIENVQRDVNIALINEFAVIFDRIGINTVDVLSAAKTKWNFLSFSPGLVGGHCIGVDPYYLTHKSEVMGYYPQIIPASRRINENMSKWLVDKFIMRLLKNKIVLADAKVLVLGFAFKENCPDTRNTKSLDVITRLKDFGLIPIVIDPYVDCESINDLYDVHVFQQIPKNQDFIASLVLVAHDNFKKFTLDEWRFLSGTQEVIMDLKAIVPIELNPIRI